MVFWVGILVGATFAWFAIKMGFYETWTMLFNIIISIYLAVFLGPVIADIVPVAGDTPYSNAVSILATAIAAFLILHCISYIFLTGQFSISFPKVFDILGAGFLGFLAGFLVWSFAGLLISISPISQNTFIKGIGFSNQFRQTNVPYISWWCNLVNTVVSSQDNEYTTQQAISGLLKKVGKKARAKAANQTTPAEPNEPAEANNVESSITEKDQPGPPPKIDY
jgi:hypothetical protein